MDDGRVVGRLSLLGRRLPPAFEVRQIALVPGQPRPYVEAEWRDALVVVERGEVEVECLTGVRWRFVAGDILCLRRLPVRGLRNHGPVSALLTAVSRRR
jgi:quercetin dioxygenase-like cupin family protein